jgi:hypothetical protein
MSLPALNSNALNDAYQYIQRQPQKLELPAQQRQSSLPNLARTPTLRGLNSLNTLPNANERPLQGFDASSLSDSSRSSSPLSRSGGFFNFFRASNSSSASGGLTFSHAATSTSDLPPQAHLNINTPRAFEQNTSAKSLASTLNHLVSAGEIYASSIDVEDQALIFWQQKKNNAACALCALLNAFQIANLDLLAALWQNQLTSPQMTYFSKVLQNAAKDGISIPDIKILADATQTLRPMNVNSAFYVLETGQNHDHMNTLLCIQQNWYWLNSTCDDAPQIIARQTLSIPDGQNLLKYFSATRDLQKLYPPQKFSVSRVTAFYLSR